MAMTGTGALGLAAGRPSPGHGRIGEWGAELTKQRAAATFELRSHSWLARSAHQVHGATGFLQEHRLAPGQPWSWCDEYIPTTHLESALDRVAIEARCLRTLANFHAHEVIDGPVLL
ncbi:hypothetical protein LWP59_05575 [Amycolatopsis acidiphila]|uniref:Acyl-CoA dehydrogenase/oxidase C-terminal domain-containing protein n=1 Tax=Amycolatopsis acidiphila TaxID=715473 RepID=A0A558AI13_9PSEU|nr:hypothetical protein [Amycolatopsis acidiphila]TVT23905.1 hypothetical protein FNH06_08590 [Amycolatopsis acidiphila]UIJ61118.1 hypothetical protein LWP59_05575 [Amycolatopsis acidiphila]GHG86639.1 hypothetical protein GCM10017788_59920 [Amycolatopsis acidiphila]